MFNQVRCLKLLKSIPKPSPLTSLLALQAILRDRSVLAGMQVFHAETGDVFRLSLPGFNPVVLVGAEATHFILTKARHDLRWRIDDDPITQLLIHGVLVEDGESHDQIRRSLNPALHKNMLSKYETAMLRRTDQIIDSWSEDRPVDMLVEMRKAALLILMDALFHVDYTPEIERLWKSVLDLIRFISPGLWLVWKKSHAPVIRKHGRLWMSTCCGLSACIANILTIPMT